NSYVGPGASPRSPTHSFAADEGEHLEASDLNDTSDTSDLNDTNDINDINDINDSELSIYFDLDSASGPALVIAHSPGSMAAAPLLADKEGEIDSHLPPALLDLSPMTDFSIQLAGIRVLASDDVTGALLDEMFFAIASMRLQSLRVVTARGVESLSNDGICKLAKDWLQSVANVTRTADNVKVLLDQARLCSEDYFSRCALGADHDGSIALEMLRNAEPNVYLFLGMDENEIVVLYRNLPFLVGKDTSIDTMDIITYVSDGLFDRFY
ncbi:hypothetical protein GGI18_003953, partial [Coemansia linderi]